MVFLLTLWKNLFFFVVDVKSFPLNNNFNAKVRFLVFDSRSNKAVAQRDFLKFLEDRELTQVTFYPGKRMKLWAKLKNITLFNTT